MSTSITLRPSAASVASSGPRDVLDAILDPTDRDAPMLSGGVEGVRWVSATVVNEATGEALVVEVHQGPRITAMYDLDDDTELARRTVVNVQVTGGSESWDWSQSYVDSMVRSLSAVVLHQG